MEAVSNSENGDDKLGGPQGESLVRSAKEPVSEASGVSSGSSIGSSSRTLQESSIAWDLIEYLLERKDFMVINNES